jgi:hypothetical protein
MGAVVTGITLAVARRRYGAPPAEAETTPTLLGLATTDFTTGATVSSIRRMSLRMSRLSPVLS